MSHHVANGRQERELSVGEAVLLRWMLEHGSPESAKFVGEIPYLRVVATCPCGCASIDFSCRGVEPGAGPLEIVADFVYGNTTSLCGAFVFAKEGVLAGLEVYGLAVEHPKRLPQPSELRPFAEEVGRSEGS